MSTMKTRRDAEAKSVGEQAAEWLLILEEGETEDSEAFADWLAQSPLHVGAFLRASAVDSLLSEVDPERSIELESEVFAREEPDVGDRDLTSNPSVLARGRSSNLERSASVLLRTSRGRWAVAACAALVVVALGSLALNRSLSLDPWKHYVTAIGEQRILELEDGSVMFLGPGSNVDVHFGDAERELRLETGEAMFQVHHDASRPFRVHSGHSVIQAVGTEFNVNRLRDESVVAVIEGVVQISRDHTVMETLLAHAEGTSSTNPQPVRLTAGEETRVADEGKIAAPVRASVDHLGAWRERRLTFINETLFTIADEFNRYNRTPKIRIEGAAVGELRYAAAFDANDPDSLMTVLERDPKLRIERQSNEIVIRAR